jgi:hypothetical protein
MSRVLVEHLFPRGLLVVVVVVVVVGVGIAVAKVEKKEETCSREL